MNKTGIKMATTTNWRMILNLVIMAILSSIIIAFAILYSTVLSKTKQVTTGGLQTEDDIKNITKSLLF